MSIHIELNNVKWGTDPIPGAENARRLNMLDEQSGILVSVAYGDEPLMNMILEMSEGLTDDQRKAVSKALLERATGLVLPTGPELNGGES